MRSFIPPSLAFIGLILTSIAGTWITYNNLATKDMRTIPLTEISELAHTLEYYRLCRYEIDLSDRVVALSDVLSVTVKVRNDGYGDDPAGLPAGTHPREPEKRPLVCLAQLEAPGFQQPTEPLLKETIPFGETRTLGAWLLTPESTGYKRINVNTTGPIAAYQFTVAYSGERDRSFRGS